MCPSRVSAKYQQETTGVEPPGRLGAYFFYSALTFSRTTATACPEPIQIPITPNGHPVGPIRSQVSTNSEFP